MPSFPSLSNISVSDIKGRALKAKDAGAHRLVNARDKYSSTSSNRFAWDPNVKPSPPPPPTTKPTPVSHRSSLSASSKAPLPPPPSRTGEWSRSQSRPDNTPPRHTPVHTPSPSTSSVTLASQLASPSDDVAHTPRFDWKHMSEDDKQVFFSWLDEFFESRLGVSLAARGEAEVQKVVSPGPAPAAVPTIQQTSRPITPPKPPTLPMWSRPKQPTADPNDFTPSYPPPTMHGSAAADLAHFFSPSSHWDSPWYASADGIPPPLQNEAPPSSTRSWQTLGNKKTIWGGVVFPDLSICWYSVTFPTTGNTDPNDTRAVQRSAQYLPRPNALDQAALVNAHETYGETIAAYAESYEGTGQYCARGECWDLAAEALKYFDQYDYVPKPVPSMSRTHGHLIFCGRASRAGAEQVGRWRGGDDRVRRGDIAEWRSARVRMAAGGYMTLGNPDHTAVIVSDSIPQTSVADGTPVRPAELGTLEVVEQGVGSPPKRMKYDLSLFEEGELWIYRPIGMLEYVGALLEPRCPDSVNALSV